MLIGRLYPQRKAAILKAISVGASRRDATADVGVKLDLLERHVLELSPFGQEVISAEITFKHKMLEHVARASETAGHWRAAAWLLARQHPGGLPGQRTRGANRR